MSDIPVSYRCKLEHCPYQGSGFTKLGQLDNAVENGGGNVQAGFLFSSGDGMRWHDILN